MLKTALKNSCHLFPGKDENLPLFHSGVSSYFRGMNRILVIGAGPAGSACAWKLAEEGISCILADQAEFPRSKVCGGALSNRAEEVLTESGMLSSTELDDLTLSTHTTMTVTSNYQELRTSEDLNPSVRLVDRREFDGFLRRRAIENGAETLKDRFSMVSGEDAVFTSGKKLSFSRMVGADGAVSRVRRFAVKKGVIRQSPALSAVVQLSPRAVEPFTKKGLQIYFFNDLYGYGWLFPRRDDVTVGVASFREPHRDIQGLMSRLLVHTGLGTSGSLTGAVLPAGEQPVTPGKGRILLAGDAAGLCDRVSGEGISAALESGMAAAGAIIQGRETWTRDARCVKLVKQSLRYRKLLYSKPFRPVAMNALKKSNKWYSRYWSIISGTADYSIIRK